MSQTHRPRRTGTLVRTVLATSLCLVAVVPFCGGWLATGAGNRAFDAADHRGADEWHALAERLALTDRWIPAYNRGVANHGARSWLAAAEQFAAAAETAPAQFQCRVRLNWAWTLEAQADELEAAGDREAAVPLWGQATQVLVEANCSDEQPEPSPEPSAQPSEPDDSGESEQDAPQDHQDAADTAEPEGSQAEQQQETLERLEEKTTGPQRPSEDGEEQETTMDPDEALRQREQDAARERAEAQDPMPAPGNQGGEGGRTW